MQKYKHIIYYESFDLAEIGALRIAAVTGKDPKVEEGSGIMFTTMGKEVLNPLKYWIEWTSSCLYSPKMIALLIGLCPILHPHFNQEILDEKKYTPEDFA